MEADLPTLLSQVCSGGRGEGLGVGTLDVGFAFFLSISCCPLVSSRCGCLPHSAVISSGESFLLSKLFFLFFLSSLLIFEEILICPGDVELFFFSIQKMLMMEIIKTFPVLFLFGCFPHSGFLFLSI